VDEAARRKSELQDLLSAVWDERLDAASRAELEKLLAEDDFAGVELLTSYTRMHLDLEWLVSSKTAQEKALNSLKQVRASQSRKIRRGFDRRTIGLATLAAGILLSVTYLWYTRWPGHEHLIRPALPIGEVVRLENADWTDGTGVQAGDPVLEGQSFEIEKGFAQLSMGFGADVLLEGPCRARILSRDRVALNQGRVAVRAAKWATGFAVETNNLVATDLGTWFSVESGREQSEIHVLEGLVLAKPVATGTSPAETRRLTADEAIDLTGDGAFREIKFRRDAVAEKLTRFEPLRPIRIWNTGIDLQVGDQDPHWTVVAGDGGGRAEPMTAVVNAPHGSYGINEPQRSQWISVAEGTTDGVPARSRYTFEMTFDLAGFDLNSVWVSGLVIADDGVDEVRLNGKRLNIAAWKDWGYGVRYVAFHPIEIRSGFVPGVNRLAIVVKNETYIIRSDRGFDLPETPNPMALRVEWQAFGRPVGNMADAD
jgi:hypothetical protein